MIEKFATKADAPTGKVSFTAWFLGFVTVNQVGQKYYNVFGRMRLHHRRFRLIHKTKHLKILKEVIFSSFCVFNQIVIGSFKCCIMVFY